MQLYGDSAEIERLVHEIVAMTGEHTTEAIRRALAERRARLQLGAWTRSRLSEAPESLDLRELGARR